MIIAALDLLDIIRTYGEDNQELEAHLASYTNVTLPLPQSSFG